MLLKIIDNKHHVQCDGELLSIVKTTNGQAIPEDEPIILFRGRDKLALPMLYRYRELCTLDGCTDFQLESMDDMIRKFEQFAATSPTMKQPGVTRGR